MTTEKIQKPSSSPTKVKKNVLTAPMSAWVKNGSTSAKHDAWLAAKLANAKQRRAEEDKKHAIAAKDPAHARVREKSLGGRKKHPCAVLGLRHPKDNAIKDWMICEITDQESSSGPDLMLMMQCPRCIHTYHRPPEETIMHIRQSNRMWHLDQRTKDERRKNPLLKTCAGEIWVSPEDKTEVVVVAGMVTTDDWCHCPICDWTFKIDDSVVWTK